MKPSKCLKPIHLARGLTDMVSTLLRYKMHKHWTITKLPTPKPQEDSINRKAKKGNRKKISLVMCLEVSPYLSVSGS